jgi:anti-sigma factor ChrR (cupin superfamily)
MRAVAKLKPKTGRMQPTPGGSIYVQPGRMAWAPTQFEKVSIKVLYEDKAKGEMTCLLRLDPGAQLPMHIHADIEQSYVIAGSITDHDGTAQAGDYVWRKVGSAHENRSDTGAVVLAVYRKPNIFQHSSGFDSRPAKKGRKARR